MTFSRKIFDKAVWEIVSSIKPGHVMSYGDVARLAGFPRHSRMVSKAMSRSVAPLPWYRVVKSDRTIAFGVGSEAYAEQLELLAAEGVTMTGRKVVTPKPDEIEDLDKLLWGPSGL